MIPTQPMLGPSSPSNGQLLRAWPTTPFQSNQMCGVRKLTCSVLFLFILLFLPAQTITCFLAWAETPVKTVTGQARTSWINNIFSMWYLHVDWPEIPARKQCCLKLQWRPRSNEQHKGRLMTGNFVFLLLQPLGCCYGKLLPMGCHHTQALTSLRCMICWKRAIGWSSQRGALPRCMSWWGHVSIFIQLWGQSQGRWEQSGINSNTWSSACHSELGLQLWSKEGGEWWRILLLKKP